MEGGYILNEVALADFFQKRINQYYNNSSKSFSELNPEFVFNNKLTVNQEVLLAKYKAGLILKEQISETDLQAFESFIKETEEIDKKIKKGELKSKTYTREELKALFIPTDEEFDRMIQKYAD